MITIDRLGAALLLVTLCATTASAQGTLARALAEADRAGYGNHIAAAQSTARAADATAALKGILPSVRFEAGYVRTTDPIGVFGATLRQRTIAAANFDPARLNHPDAIGNYQGGVVVEQPIVNADAWAGRRAATAGVDASRAAEEWARINTRVDIVRAYFGAALAAERAATLESAAAAARGHVAQANAMVKAGLATKSDALLAAVRAGDVEAQLIEASAGAVTARRQLAVAMGMANAELPSGVSVPARLPDAAAIRAVLAPDTIPAAIGDRADVRAASSAMDAASADLARARSARLPRLNSFARYDWNSAARLYAGERNWSVGIVASWNLFDGASELADAQATAGRRAQAEAQVEAALASARLDGEQTRTALVVALARLAIAERAVAQSAEAHRIIARKYEGGLATVVELLDAQAGETASALAHSQARWSAITAAAERRRALGLDPAALAALESTNSPAITGRQ